MLQLNPPIPFYSIEHDDWGYALLVLDYSQEHNTLFLIALQKTGELWWIDNTKLRMTENWSLNRIYAKTT